MTGSTFRSTGSTSSSGIAPRGRTATGRRRGCTGSAARAGSESAGDAPARPSSRWPAELLDLYARRKVTAGYAFPPDSKWQRELESSFLYEDTPDQRKATEEVKRDMERPLPMDRLLVGDVGYGKTEVAVRAAFKAVQGGKQVAVLVPTTILAEQHGRTFSNGWRTSRSRSRCCRDSARPRSRRRRCSGSSPARSTSSSAPTGCSRRTSISRTSACWSWTRSTGSA